MWEHQDQFYRDDLIRLFVDVPDILESRSFFEDFKELLKARFSKLISG